MVQWRGLVLWGPSPLCTSGIQTTISLRCPTTRSQLQRAHKAGVAGAKWIIIQPVALTSDVGRAPANESRRGRCRKIRKKWSSAAPEAKQSNKKQQKNAFDRSVKLYSFADLIKVCLKKSPCVPSFRIIVNIPGVENLKNAP